MNTVGKLLVSAGIFGTGIVIGGVTWNGSDSIDNIEGNVNEMEQEIQDALQDNEYLQEQFNALMATHNESIEEANTEINRLEGTRSDLLAQIEDLQNVAEGDYSEDEEEIQAEITRLEDELKKANQEVADLETYVQEVSDRTNYEGIDRDAFNAGNANSDIAQGSAVQYTGAIVDLVGQEDAVRLASASIVSQIADMYGGEIGKDEISVTQVTTYDGAPAFNMDDSKVFSHTYTGTYTEQLEKFASTIGQGYYIIDSNGDARYYE